MALNTGDQTRRQFLFQSGISLGGLALNKLMQGTLGGHLDLLPKAKRMIYLFQSGGPSQHDLFDYKPLLNEMNGKDLPDSVRKGRSINGLTAGQESLPLAGAQFKFKQHGASGAWLSELLPYTAEIADELCFIRSMQTDAINHDPAITFFQTGSQQPGRPCIGSWLSYGLGQGDKDLPEFTVLLSNGTGKLNAQPLYSRLWGNGFLPSVHQGIQLRSAKDPVLYLSNPPGVDSETRKAMLSTYKVLQSDRLSLLRDPEIETRIAQYEMAFRMQTSVPEVMDFSEESQHIYELYGPESRIPGTYASNCLLARRLLERGVNFIQLYHRGWDQHTSLPKHLRRQCLDTDQASAALVKDLKQRGLLEDTVVVWGGEFGRTNYSQGKLTHDDYGRDHHPHCFTMWICGGGVKKGITFGKTDDFGYNIVQDPVHVHDFQATLLKLFGLNHEHLTYKHQGRYFRLTDVHGRIVDDILA